VLRIPLRGAAHSAPLTLEPLPAQRARRWGPGQGPGPKRARRTSQSGTYR